MDKDKFQSIIIEAFESLPMQFKEKLENVDIVIEENLPQKMCRGVLLGLYRGIPLKKRSVWYNATLPDKITIFKHSILKTSSTPEEIKAQVRQTVIHEIGHHFGLSDAELK